MQNQKLSSFLHKTFFGKITGHFLDLEWQLPDKLLLKNPGIGVLRAKLTPCHRSFATSKNSPDIFQTLENFLTELNLYNLKPKHRFLLLESARKVLWMWHSMLLEEANDPSFQTTSFVTLETLLAQNYLNTLDAWTEQGVFLRNQSFLNCIHRVIDTLTNVRFWQILVGESTESTFWKPINTLYQFAERYRIHKRRCQDRARGWFYGTNIQKSFLKLCLFEISRPQTLSLEERVQLLEFLEREAGLATVKKYFSDDSMFVVDLWEKHPPSHQATYPVKPQGLWRAVDPTPLLALLQNNYTGVEVLPPTLIQKLIKYWTVESHKLPKIPSASHTKVILGLHNLYALTNNPESAPPPSIQTCELTHMRPGSYCLCWQHDGGVEIPKRGDVIGIQYWLQNQSLYCVGVIKWLKRKSEEQYQMGIQVIAPTFLGVLLKLPSRKFCSQALLLPNLRGERQPMTLLTPRLVLPSGEKVTLRVENKNYFVQLTRLLHSTHQYHHYTFKVDHEPQHEKLTVNWLKVS